LSTGGPSPLSAIGPRPGQQRTTSRDAGENAGARGARGGAGRARLASDASRARATAARDPEVQC
jgi:hypothetical protein